MLYCPSYFLLTDCSGTNNVGLYKALITMKNFHHDPNHYIIPLTPSKFSPLLSQHS